MGLSLPGAGAVSWLWWEGPRGKAAAPRPQPTSWVSLSKAGQGAALPGTLMLCSLSHPQHTHMPAHTCTCMHMHTHMHVCTRVHACMCAPIHTRVCTFTPGSRWRMPFEHRPCLILQASTLPPPFSSLIISSPALQHVPLVSSPLGPPGTPGSSLPLCPCLMY